MKTPYFWKEYLSFMGWMALITLVPFGALAYFVQEWSVLVCWVGVLALYATANFFGTDEHPQCPD